MPTAPSALSRAASVATSKNAMTRGHAATIYVEDLGVAAVSTERRVGVGYKLPRHEVDDERAASRQSTRPVALGSSLARVNGVGIENSSRCRSVSRT